MSSSHMCTALDAPPAEVGIYWNLRALSKLSSLHVDFPATPPQAEGDLRPWPRAAVSFPSSILTTRVRVHTLSQSSLGTLAKGSDLSINCKEYPLSAFWGGLPSGSPEKMRPYVHPRMSLSATPAQ